MDSVNEELRQPFLPLHVKEEERQDDEIGVGRSPDRVENEEALVEPLSPLDDEPFLKMLKRAKKNVKRTLALTFFAFCSRTLWSQTVLSMFLALVWTQHLEYIGYVTAIVGLTQVISSALTKWIFLRRFQLFHTAFLVITSILGMVATGLLIVAVWTTSRDNNNNDSVNHWILLVSSMGFWGTVWGMSEAFLPVVFSESASLVEKQSFRTCSRLIKGGNIVGNILVLALFYWCGGNEWTISSCSVVLVIGLFLNLQVFFLLCSLKFLPLDDDDGGDDDDLQNFEEIFGDDEDPCHLEESVQEVEMNIVDIHHDLREQETTCPEIYEEGVREDNRGECLETQCDSTPFFYYASEILTTFAGGMSIRYLPVYLIQSLGLDPLQVQSLYLLVVTGQWLSPFVASKVSYFCGPVLTRVGIQSAFVALFVSMILCQEYGVATWIVCTLYCIQGSLLNSTSKLADVTGATHGLSEGKQMLLWSGGAAVGGYIAGSLGLPNNFYIASAIQLCASAPLLILYCTECSRDGNEIIDDGYHDCFSTVNEEGGTVFQDCLSQAGDCNGIYCSEATSPAVSDATSDTESTTSSSSITSDTMR